MAAAADLDPEKLTLQAVADSLGVDRKAVTYHISKREELLALMGAEALAAQLEDLVLPKADWKAAVRVFAVGTRDALLRERTLGIYVTEVSTWALMKPAEQLAEILLDAGFGDDAAGRALALITAVAHESARAQLLTDQFGEHPRESRSYVSSTSCPKANSRFYDGSFPSFACWRPTASTST